MFRYILVFLLLNSSYRSFGGPVPSNAPVTIANLLTALANSCENKFLSDQMKTKLDYCAEITSVHQGKQLECLLFYDINSQLCTAIGHSRLVLTTDDYSDKIIGEQDVTQLCETTNDWVFSNITEFTRYKHSVEKVFEHPAMCGKVCGVEDLISDDANFFCKYFKWGTDVLKRQIGVAQENGVVISSETEKVDTKPVNSAFSDIDVQIKNKNSTPTTSNLPLVSEPVKNERSNLPQAEPVKDEAFEIKPEMSSANSAPSEKPTSNKVEESVPVAENQLVASDPSNQEEDKPIVVTSAELKSEDQKPETPDTTLTKPDAGPLPKSDVDKELEQQSHDLGPKESVIETPAETKEKLPNDPDDYQDSEDGKDGLGDIPGEDDSDDAMIGDINKINKLEDLKEDKEIPLKNAVSDITGESRLFPSFGGDDDADDDDHFFSFFLTAVIMAVLIYVLYHNKNKVGKVFFGLILEGRQSGRRRNSRGHSYRRLDTLEQAMSTNTTAPPSKIIY